MFQDSFIILWEYDPSNSGEAMNEGDRESWKVFKILRLECFYKPHLKQTDKNFFKAQLIKLIRSILNNSFQNFIQRYFLQMFIKSCKY